MKVIADVEKQTLRMLENERSIFRGEYGVDKLELYINKRLENEYPTITGLLSNGRKIGPYTTDDAYSIETIDGVEYTKASFTLSEQNGFMLSEGKLQITIWMNSDEKKEAIGNVTLNVINTTAFDGGDIIISGDVAGTIVNYRVELENLQSQINTSNIAFNNRITMVEQVKADKQYVDTQDEEISRRIDQVEQTKADLSYVKTQDEKITKKVDANTTNISTNTQNVDRLIEHVTSINNSITSLNNRVGTNESKITKLNDDVADLYLTKVNVGDVYDKTETDNKLVNKVDSNYLTSNYFDKEQIKGMLGTTSALDFKIVDSLPTDNISATTIYLVPYGNEYEEYFYINNKWEMLGSTKVDLSDYVRKDDIVITNENGTTKAVGGIPAGTILTGKNVLQVLEDILYPYVAFGISVDSISPSTSVYEKGTTATITGVTVKITNGSRSITNLKLYDSSSKTNLLGEKTSGISTSNTFTISRAVTSNTSFYAEATDGVKTIGDSTSFLSFYYPTFYGVLDTGYSLTSSLITGKTKVLKANKNNTFTYTATNQHPFVAFPASYGNLTSIKDSSNLEYIGDFVKTTMNLNVTGGTVSYNIYVLKDPTDISNYKFIFS